MEGAAHDDTIRRLALSHALELAESGTITGDECGVLFDAIAMSFAGETPPAPAIELLQKHGFLDPPSADPRGVEISRHTVDYRAFKRKPSCGRRHRSCSARPLSPTPVAARWRAWPPVSTARK